MKPSLDVYSKKCREFDAIDKNIVELRNMINSNEYFKLSPEYRSMIISEYHAASTLKIILKNQIEYLKSILRPGDVPNII